MNYQLIALDLDGTLLNSRKELPEDAVRAGHPESLRCRKGSGF